MSRIVTATFCAAALALVSLGAQTPPTQTPSPQAPASTGIDDKTITATGCVKLGSDGKTYYLVNAEGPAAVGTAGSPASQKTFRLQPGMGLDLSKHVGHKVQAIGSPAKTGAGSPTGTTGQTSSDAWAKDAKDLQVTLIKHVADTCE